MILYSFFILISYILICKYWKHLQFWRRRCVTYSKPVPFFGNFFEVVFRKISFPARIKQLYDEFPENRYIGIFDFNTPKLLIRDKKLVEEIFVKNFSHFTNRKSRNIRDVDEMLGRSLYFLDYNHWKQIRPRIDKTFGIVSREKLFETIMSSIEESTNYLLENVSKRKQPINLETNEFFRRITNDVFATLIFDHKSNSLLDNNNKFYAMMKKFTKTEALTSLKIFLSDSFPFLQHIFKNVQAHSKDCMDYFRGLLFKETESKEEILRDNLLFSYLINEVNSGTIKNIGKEDVIAQVLSFFFVGFEPLAITMTFLAYELAINVHVQKKLQMEIDQILYADQEDGSISFDNFLKIRYIDAIIFETLRKWSSSILSERTCTKDYILPVGKRGETGLRIEKGEVIILPVHGFHHDENQFVHPEKFDPGRFLGQNIHEICNNFSFYPFGLGPRNCIAMDLSILIMKIIFLDIVSKFEICTVEKTEIPLKLRKTTYLAPQNKFFLGFKPRK